MEFKQEILKLSSVLIAPDEGMLHPLTLRPLRGPRRMSMLVEQGQREVDGKVEVSVRVDVGGQRATTPEGEEVDVWETESYEEGMLSSDWGEGDIIKTL